MQAIQGITNFVFETIPAQYAQAGISTIGAGAFCGVVAAEMGLLAVSNGYQMVDHFLTGRSFSGSSGFVGLPSSNQ
jgi:hypothetical protein